MTKPDPNPSRSQFRPHDLVAFVEGPPCSRRALPDWLDPQAPVRVTQEILARPGWPDVVFAFHDGEEIGPRMLARIAKRTGLKPEDL